ncbi:hypothetical protein LCGC14_1783410 [marine sediment metagenome]|uniref:Uncharacterized protein n=1 Tax=marine sediment metagenome TaxID=412755 RepID=A0A0F9GUM9_9ZZZZ
MTIADAYWAWQDILRYETSDTSAADRAYMIKVNHGLPLDEAIDLSNELHPKAIAEVRSAALYHIADEVSSIIDHAANTMPDVVPYGDEQPFPVGLIVWESPSDVDCLWDCGVPHPAFAGLWTSGPWGTAFTFFVKGQVGNIGVPMHVAKTVEAEYGRTVTDSWMRWIYAFWTFLSQELIVMGKARSPRAVRHHARRQGCAEPLIRVVRLRRIHKKAFDSEDGTAVEWSHRWMVRGHWRNQPYPREGRVRPKWIMPYVKGPEDKPFEAPRPTIFDVSR